MKRELCLLALFMLLAFGNITAEEIVGGDMFSKVTSSTLRYPEIGEIILASTDAVKLNFWEKDTSVSSVKLVTDDALEPIAVSSNGSIIVPQKSEFPEQDDNTTLRKFHAYVTISFPKQNDNPMLMLDILDSEDNIIHQESYLHSTGNIKIPCNKEFTLFITSCSPIFDLDLFQWRDEKKKGIDRIDLTSHEYAGEPLSYTYLSPFRIKVHVPAMPYYRTLKARLKLSKSYEKLGNVKIRAEDLGKVFPAVTSWYVRLNPDPQPGTTSMSILIPSSQLPDNLFMRYRVFNEMDEDSKGRIEYNELEFKETELALEIDGEIVNTKVSEFVFNLESPVEPATIPDEPNMQWSVTLVYNSFSHPFHEKTDGKPWDCIRGIRFYCDSEITKELIKKSESTEKGQEGLLFMLAEEDPAWM